MIAFTSVHIGRGSLFACALSCALVAGLVETARAQPTSPAATVSVGEGPTWQSLSAAQKSVLSPLAREWNSIDTRRKVKWVEIADRFPRLPPAEQARIKERMVSWAKLSPQERGRARQNYKDTQQRLSPEERKARWDAYKALPPDERKELAERSSPASPPPIEKRRVPTSAERTNKSNIVSGAPYAVRPKQVAPTLTQAQPGATTNPITKRATPPAHQQAGLPKIAATPGFVDKKTLLPKRGPQGAGARSEPASAPQPVLR